MTPRTFLMAAVATAATATLASAQTQPASSGQSPFWESASATTYTPPAENTAVDAEESTDADAFPKEIALEVAPAHAQFAALRAARQIVMEQIDERLARMQDAFERSDEYTQARQERVDSYAARDEARRNALAVLRADDEYVAASSLKDRIERDLRAAHEGGASQGDILAMSELALSYGQQIFAAEQRELAGSPAVEVSRDRARAADERLAELERSYRDRVINDVALENLRGELRQLTVATEAAMARYDSTVRAANIATDFAFTRTFELADQQGGSGQPFGLYSTGGKGFGGYSPYSFGSFGFGGLNSFNFGVPNAGFGFSKFGFGGFNSFGSFHHRRLDFSGRPNLGIIRSEAGDAAQRVRGSGTTAFEPTR